VTFATKALDHVPRDVLIREKAHHSAASTVSCCM
jgi:hypothetical protein